MLALPAPKCAHVAKANEFNDVLFHKLKTIFASVLDAAAVAENWIVIDRTNAKSPAAELLIEAAMGQLMIPAYPAPFAYTANQAHLLAIASDALALAAGRIA